MRNHYLLFLAFLSIPFFSWGQSISLQSNGLPSSRCSGDVVSLTFITSGNFGAGNKFTVQYTADYGQTFTDLPGSFASSPISTTLPASLTRKPSYGFRIVASNPQISSSWGGGFAIVTTPTGDLTGVTTFPAEPQNPYASGLLRMKLTGGASYSIILQDSTKYVQQADLGDNYAYDITVRPARTTTYQIIGIQNACGSGSVGTTKATVRVNPVGLQLLNPESSLCRGTTLSAYYATDGPLPVTPSFGAELIYPANGNQSVALPVSGTASPLQIQIPDGLPNGSGLKLRIYDTKNGLSQYYGANQFLTVLGKPRFQFDQTQWQVGFGETISLPFSYTSDGYGQLTTNDGRVFTINGWGRQEFAVRPTETTSYSLASFTGQCDYAASFSNRQVTVAVMPGARIDSLSASEACVGTPVTLYYTASPGYNLPPNLLLRLERGAEADLRVVKPGQAVFTFAESVPSSHSLRIVLVDKATGQPIASAPLLFNLKNKPSVTFASTGYIPDRTGSWTPTVDWLGGGKTEVLLADGQRFMLTGNLTDPFSRFSLGEIYVSQSTTYSIVSARNECGVNNDVSSVRVNITPVGNLPAGVYLSIDNTNYSGCPGAKRWFNLTTAGSFAADNQFQVQLSNSNGQFTTATTLTTVSGMGSFSITLPTTTGLYQLRVVTTNPVTRSGEVPVPVFTNVAEGSVTLRLGSTVGGKYTVNSSLTVAAGQAVFANYGLTGQSIIQYELSDGSRGYTGSDNYKDLNPVYTPTVTTEYAIRKLVDGCGRTPNVPGKATAVVVPYVLTINASPLPTCINLPAMVGFTRTGTALPAGGSYVVQASEDGKTYQDVPTSGTASPLTVTLSKVMAGKKWYYRVAYRLGSTDLYSDATSQPTPLSDVPSVVLSGQAGEQAISVKPGSSASLLVREEAGSGATVFLTDGQNRTLSTLSKQDVFSVSDVGTYRIGTVYNQCGYGTGMGSVRVTRGASINRISLSKSGYCEDEPISLSYVVGGDFDAANKFAVYVVNQATAQQQLLGEPTPATGEVVIPKGLKTGLYTVRIVTAAPSATLTSGIGFRVQTPVSATLTSAVRAVYANDLLALPIRSVGGLPFSLTLSNGQVEVISLNQQYMTVQPSQSTSYSVARAENGCGVIAVSGVQSVSVLSTAGVTLRWVSLYGNYCINQKVEADYMPTGTFGADNMFMLLLSDSTGRNFQPIATATPPQRLTAVIPAETVPGSGYLLRVASSSPAHVGPTFGPVTVGSTPTATLTGNTSIVKGDSARVSIALTGTPPWQFVLTDFFGPRSFTATTSPYILIVRPDTTRGFRLTDVRNNQCGTGTVSGTALITVSPLLATEPALPLGVRTWPNPTAGVLYVAGELAGLGTLVLSLHSLPGQLVQQQTVQPSGNRVSNQLDLSALPAGVYILTAEQDGRRSQFKVLKQ